MSDSPGVVDFATGPVNSVLKLPEGKVKFFGSGEFKLQKNCNQSCSSKYCRASLNDSWAGKCQLKLARMASFKTDLLCTLIVLLTWYQHKTVVNYLIRVQRKSFLRWQAEGSIY